MQTADKSVTQLTAKLHHKQFYYYIMVNVIMDKIYVILRLDQFLCPNNFHRVIWQRPSGIYDIYILYVYIEQIIYFYMKQKSYIYLHSSTYNTHTH